MNPILSISHHTHSVTKNMAAVSQKVVSTLLLGNFAKFRFSKSSHRETNSAQNLQHRSSQHIPPGLKRVSLTYLVKHLTTASEKKMPRLRRGYCLDTQTDTPYRLPYMDR